MLFFKNLTHFPVQDGLKQKIEQEAAIIVAVLFTITI